MKKVVVIVGPTAIGKTKISIALAKKIQAEIISGDSVQVYRGLNIGSAKITSEEMDGVKHHLIDVMDPKEQYSVYHFQQQARTLINQIEIPMIVGGTGLYIQACLYHYEFDAPKRSDAVEEEYKEHSNEVLYEMLLSLDPEATKQIHPHNRKRILRALEVWKSGEPISSKNKRNELLYQPFIIYLNCDRGLLYQRINQRVDQMFEEGLLEEVEILKQQGIYPDSIGYREFRPYFMKECTLEEVKEEIKKNTRHLAKRQMTWFRNQMDTHFYEVDITNMEDTIQKIYHDLEEFLKGE